MTKHVLGVAAALAATLTAVNLQARHSGAADPARVNGNAQLPQHGQCDISWRYRLSSSHWWYWSPENRWLIWTGGTWVPQQRLAQGSGDQTVVHSAAFASYPRQENQGPFVPEYRQEAGGGVSDYAGYGWSWGPGTAYRSAPGRRW